MTLIHVDKRDAPVEVTVYAISREKNNNDHAMAMAVFEIPLCEKDGEYARTLPIHLGSDYKQ